MRIMRYTDMQTPVARFEPTADMGKVAVHFNDLREIVIYGIELQLMITAPGDCFLQSVPSAAGPEDELVSGSFLINKVFDQWSVWFAELRPVAVAEGSVKVYGDDLICCCTHDGPPFFGLCIKPRFMCLSVLQFSGYVV